jgi:hypothetical protein
MINAYIYDILLDTTMLEIMFFLWVFVLSDIRGLVLLCDSYHYIRSIFISL